MVREVQGKYNPGKLESEVLKYWKEKKVYDKLVKAKEGGKKYYFLDGPPYANAQPHIGHARTRAIRDPVLKYQRMLGKDVRLQAGFDCHGLPIEVKVEEEIGSKHKHDIEEYGVDRFIAKCKERATKYVGVWNDFYRRYGMHLDFDNPYLTLYNDYIESTWAFFKKAQEKKLLYKGQRTVDWCPRCETPLSNYEASDAYKDVEDFSIYVKFPVVGKKNEFIVIWTTTPWTLPANIAVAVNPKFTYSLIEVKGEKWYLAKDLIPIVLKAAEIEKHKVLKTFKGKDMVGIKYRHCLEEEVPIHKEFAKQKNVHEVVTALYVTMEDGTGCVHTAPGHGPEDYSTGVKYRMPIFSPVNDSGHYTKEAGKYEGLALKDANEVVCDDLKAKGLMVHQTTIVHRYAHCWRCKAPLITRASEQWFINIEKIKDKMVKENRKVRWVPEWAGSKRFEHWLEGARDWCISRQRYWGIPLPIWPCECGHYEVIGSVDELKKKAISMPKELDLHKPWIDTIRIKCPKCGKEVARSTDICDVWFDSGAATWASLGYPKDKKAFNKWFPVDFITEGLDQTRGWFYTLMVEGIIMFDRRPYETVLMNDFVLDSKGNKMSKSEGNVTDPHEVMEKYGGDIARFYLLWETAPWNKLCFNWDNAGVVYKIMNILWNSYAFASTYMALNKFTGKELKSVEKSLKFEDKWIISRINTVTNEVTEAFESLDLYKIPRSLGDFVVEDFSRWYIKLIRPRVKATGEEKDRLAALCTLDYVLKRLSRLLAPLTPFIAEEMFLNLDEGYSVHGCDWPKSDGKRINKKLEKQMNQVKEVTEAASRARQQVGIKLRYPLPTIFVPKSLKGMEDTIAEMCNFKEVKFEELKVKLQAKPNFAKIGPKFGKDAGAVAKAISGADAEKLAKDLEKGKAKLGKFTLEKEDVKLVEAVAENIAAEELSFGRLYIDATQDKELINEAFARELIRAVQELRKEKGYKVGEEIELQIDGDVADIKKFFDRIAEGVSAKSIKEKVEKSFGECEFEGKKIKIGFKRC